ncbi:hypothetical protein Val02_07090 [Virgisporangium aliadipatigenens]|uniref:Uncharacterized protein n=1 Tax=Virgisporangium aliadipatigenens TaxID=741659 RepID=A0A8J3YH00_9ACTN|nr:hypothetical protein Val02_07090 [Virgisporangium aliadipatigenens]
MLVSAVGLRGLAEEREQPGDPRDEDDGTPEPRPHEVTNGSSILIGM